MNGTLVILGYSIHLRTLRCHPWPLFFFLQNLNRGKFGDVVNLAYQVGGALSTCRLPFRSMILDRYPEQDSAKFPFPGDQLPMFVYPKVCHPRPVRSIRVLVLVALTKLVTYVSCWCCMQSRYMTHSAPNRRECTWNSDLAETRRNLHFSALYSPTSMDDEPIRLA